jgi:hypothetical protein
MSFSKIRNDGQELFITIVKDEAGNELAKWKVARKDYPKVLRIINKDFGLDLLVLDRKKKKKDSDLDWAI